MQLHLDPLGGIAGDMFIAAVLDAFPELEKGVLSSICSAGLDGEVSCRLSRHHDAVLQGARFTVDTPLLVEQPHNHDGRHRDDQPHRHASWAAIRRQLDAAGLADPVRKEAIAIFSLLADAEARVHGVEPEAVVFHEVGALDSIADIVGAAHLISALGATRWTVAPLPLGSGRVKTAHGVMPVPAPATALLLQGFLTLEDGISGERVTPTGAAIVAHLCERSGRASQGPRTLVRSGIGFGSKALPGIANCLRVLAFDEAEATGATAHRELAVIEFEVDDQSAEDLATGLDRLRDHEAILDAVQMPVFGKKGRMMTHVRLLAVPRAIDAVMEACFRETTTIGLRHRIVSGAALPRRIEEVDLGGGQVLRVKTVERPGGRTAKAEADDAARASSQAERSRLRQSAERRALDKEVAQ
jgi:uncharacterized protein (TIGR00299 family) protein